VDNFFFKGSAIRVAGVCDRRGFDRFLLLHLLAVAELKVPWRPVLRTSIYTGIIWLVAKLIFVAALPHMDLESLYGPFYVSVGLLLWAYVSGLILFAGRAVQRVAVWGSRSLQSPRSTGIAHC
jgi:membrane protein